MGVRSKLWTREEYDRLVAAGAFMPDARLQLIDGKSWKWRRKAPHTRLLCSGCKPD